MMVIAVETAKDILDRLVISSMAAALYGIETIDITNQVYLLREIGFNWTLSKPKRTTVELQEPDHD